MKHLARIFHTLLCCAATLREKFRSAFAPFALSGLTTKPPGGFVFSPHFPAIFVEITPRTSSDMRTKHLEGEKCGLASTKLWTSLAIARRATAGLFTLTLTFTFTLPLTSFADTTVPTQTVGSGQTLTVVDPGKVDTATPGPVQVQPGGKAVVIGGTSVVLKPGFKADSGSLFRASQDLNLAGLEDLDDTDFDGLPDAWELLHFGNLTSATGTGDNDSDGVSNANEYRAGTSPGLNEASAGWPSGAQVVLKMPNGKFQKVLTDWSITNAP